MTAGTAATSAETTLLHACDPTLPYQPRSLSRGERNRRELFVFFSPRNQRIVTIADAVYAAMALQLEFDPTIARYVERPRRLLLKPKQEIDVSFWTRTRDGEERFHLVIPESGTMSSTSGTVCVRDRTQLDEAAARHGITLHYSTEFELLSASTWLATAFELLPHVWWGGRQLNRAQIRLKITQRLGNVERVKLSDLIATLGHSAAQIRAVVAGMIHDGTLRLVDYQPGALDAVLEASHA